MLPATFARNICRESRFKDYRDMRKFVVAAVSVAAAGLFAVGSALGELLPIVNPGFEANFAAPNTFPVLLPTGWTRYDPQNIIDWSADALGVLNPTGSTFFPAGAPEGNNAALVYISGDIGTGPVGLSQALPAVLSVDTRYTLTVEVGNIASGTGPPQFGFFDLDGFPGYAVQLLAGGVVVAEDHNSLFGQIPEGQFRTSVVALDVDAANPRLGQQLQVRLLNLNVAETAENPGIEVDFDHVRLDASALCSLSGDLDGDHAVNLSDLATLLANFGRADAPGAAAGDVDRDGDVDLSDLATLLASFGAACG